MPTAPLIQCPTDHWRAEHERRRESRVAAETNKKWQGVKLEHTEGESLVLTVAPFPSGVEFTERRSPKSLAATPGAIAPTW